MRPKIRVFVDSDVVISSLISKNGAAFLLLNSKLEVDYFISNYSLKELRTVLKRLVLSEEHLDNLVRRSLKIVKVLESMDLIKDKYVPLVLDAFDAHILAGAKSTKADFLITYNEKHYKVDKIKGEFKIVVFTPAKFLQYLRSR